MAGTSSKERPGGYTPALSEVLPVVERSGIWVTFAANRGRVRAIYDERFCRM